MERDHRPYPGGKLWLYNTTKYEDYLVKCPPDQFRCWAFLLISANEGQGGQRGSFIVTETLVEEVAGGDSALVERTIALLVKERAVVADSEGVYSFRTFGKRQYVAKSDRPEAVAQRVAASRARKRERNDDGVASVASPFSGNTLPIEDVTRYTIPPENVTRYTKCNTLQGENVTRYSGSGNTLQGDLPHPNAPNADVAPATLNGAYNVPVAAEAEASLNLSNASAAGGSGGGIDQAVAALVTHIPGFKHAQGQTDDLGEVAVLAQDFPGVDLLVVANAYATATLSQTPTWSRFRKWVDQEANRPRVRSPTLQPPKRAVKKAAHDFS